MANKTVRCVCANVEMSGTYKVQGQFLIFMSPLGTTKAVIGLQDPRKLAARILKNTCKKALKQRVLTANPAIRPLKCAKERVDQQRERIVAMAPDHTCAAAVLLKPQEESEDASCAALPASALLP